MFLKPKMVLSFLATLAKQAAAGERERATIEKRKVRVCVCVRVSVC